MRTIICMMMTFVMLSFIASAECVGPESSMIITDDVLFCPGEYLLDDGIVIRSDDVAISCNDTKIFGKNESAGIELNGYEDVSITGCTISGFQQGIFALSSQNLTITSNELTGNLDAGLVLYSVENSIISGNDISFNHNDGLGLFEVMASEISDNTITGNADSGITLQGSDSNMFFGNSLYNPMNVRLNDTKENVFYSNTFTGSSFEGLESDYTCYEDRIPNEYINTEEIKTGCFSGSETPEPAVNNDETKKNNTENNDSNESNQTVPEYELTEYLNIVLDDDYDLAVNRFIDWYGSGNPEMIKQKAIELTESAKISKKIYSTEKKTYFETDIVLDEPMDDLWVLELIPKTTINDSDRMIEILPEGFFVVDKDPLLAWHFTAINNTHNISYVVRDELTGDTKTILLSEIEDKKKRPISLLFPVLLVPLITIAIVYFNRFKKYE